MLHDSLDSRTKRQKLLAHLPWFVRSISKVEGVRKISILGSITTEKLKPKDIDFLVMIEDSAELEPVARLGRKLKGRTGSEGSGADIFLTDTIGNYIGRTCSWKECRRGARMSCDALNCGRRQYLHDDLHAVTLSQDSIAGALQLWPTVEERIGLPEDLETVVEELKYKETIKPGLL
jgi:predicted nucleotidyltransferase